MENTKSKWLKVLAVVVSIVIVAVLGSIFVGVGMVWFNSLVRPTQWIPNIVIPIVWTIIYIIFGVILSRWVWSGVVSKTITILLVMNGILNVLWCLVFFTLRLTFIGNIVIVFNLIMGYLLYYAIYKNNRLYSYFIVIYPIWLSLATTLNLALWILN